jgi:hypothetical protein
MPILNAYSLLIIFPFEKSSRSYGHSGELSGSRGKNRVLRVKLLMLCGQERSNFAAALMTKREME